LGADSVKGHWPTASIVERLGEHLFVVLGVSPQSKAARAACDAAESAARTESQVNPVRLPRVSVSSPPIIKPPVESSHAAEIITLNKVKGVITIESPVLGLLDLTAGAVTAEVESDKAILGPIFRSVSESGSEPPRCDVLFVYCHFEPDGRIQGTNLFLRDLIHVSGAAVLVVATANTAEQYNRLVLQGKTVPGPAPANLVVTMDRRGEGFGRFFYQLFTEMKSGIPMPAAWVKLAPQLPRDIPTDAPQKFFVAEIGQVAFR
jgi:hypothetical protein